MKNDEMKPKRIAESLKEKMNRRREMGYNDVPGMIMYSHNGNRTEWIVIKQNGVLNQEQDTLDVIARYKAKRVRSRLQDMGIITVELK